MATYLDIFFNQILKRDSIDKIDNFLKTPKKILKKKRQLINVFEQRRSIIITILISILDKCENNN